MDLYYDQIALASKQIEWDSLKNKTVLITGATGLIGSCIVDFLMYRNLYFQNQIKVMALGRNVKRAEKIFNKYWNNGYFKFIKHDITKKIQFEEKIDYIINAASAATPCVFAVKPVEVMLGNILGTKNMLELAKHHQAKVLYVSSAEVYGESELVQKAENDYGYINHIDMRASYPISKKAAETLAISYLDEYGVDTVICRLSHVYGPTATEIDNRASSEFIRAGLTGKNIVLKNTLTVYRSYTYVVDAVSAIVFLLLNSKYGEVYNVSNPNSVISIREFAECIAKISDVKLVTEEPSEMESKGFTKISRQVVDSTKLLELGWKPYFDFEEGIRDTITIMRDSWSGREG